MRHMHARRVMFVSQGMKITLSDGVHQMLLVDHVTIMESEMFALEKRLVSLPVIRLTGSASGIVITPPSRVVISSLSLLASDGTTWLPELMVV